MIGNVIETKAYIFPARTHLFPLNLCSFSLTYRFFPKLDWAAWQPASQKNKTHFHSLSLRTVGHLYIGRVLEPKHRLRSVYCGRRWFIMPLICRSYFDHHGSPSLLFSSSLLSPFGSPRFTFLRFNFENPWKSQQSFVDKSSSKELSAEDSDFVLDNNLYQESEIEVSKSFVPFLQSSDKSDPRKESCPDVSPKLGGVILKFSIVAF